MVNIDFKVALFLSLLGTISITSLEAFKKANEDDVQKFVNLATHRDAAGMIDYTASCWQFHITEPEKQHEDFYIRPGTMYAVIAGPKGFFFTNTNKEEASEIEFEPGVSVVEMMCAKSRVAASSGGAARSSDAASSSE